MMNIKTLLSILAITSLLFVACKKDEDIAKPVITIYELGNGENHENDHTATIGGELHMDIEVIAEGKIDYMQVLVHPEGEHEEGEYEGWEIDTIFSGTGITGLKNLDFHKHLDIDEQAEAGEYHFDFIVSDMEGYQSSAEAELSIIAE